jgi:3-deoxy-D-manno-octulosonic-acid transferase
MQAYAAADFAFVGGSLVTGVGGHNLIEPAALAVPTLTGPHGFNAVDIANALLEERALTMVGDVDELQREVRRLALDPRERHRRGELGQRFVERNRGTLERLLKLLEPIIADARSRSASR